jgi:hypothetical protein
MTYVILHLQKVPNILDTTVQTSEVLVDKIRSNKGLVLWVEKTPVLLL